MISREELKRRINIISDKIDQACEKSDRKPEDIKTMVVTKNNPLEVVKMAYDFGFRLFGENRIQEANEKFSNSQALDLDLHMIGHLQSNKARLACNLCSCIQSIDKIKTALEVDKQAKALNKLQKIMIQVNTSEESQKSGVPNIDELWKLLDQILDLPNLQLTGLMTLGPFNAPEKKIRACFSQLRNIREKIQNRYGKIEANELSMGMSDDFHWAIEEGATLIRLGRSLLGERYE